MPIALDKYRLLGHTGLRVSPLSLGTMTFGTNWGWGADQDECRRMFDLFADRGGNFIDTANTYTDGTSESFVGEFIEGRRNRFVIATKYTCNTDPPIPSETRNNRRLSAKTASRIPPAMHYGTGAFAAPCASRASSNARYSAALAS